MQTLFEQRHNVIDHRYNVVTAPLDFYVLVEGRHHPSRPSRASFALQDWDGIQSIMLFVSPVDAEIRRRNVCGSEGKFKVCPLEAIDPRKFTYERGGELRLSVVYGFAAQENMLLQGEDGIPCTLSYMNKFQFPLESLDGGHLVFRFSEELLDWLIQAYRDVGLPDHHIMVREQAKCSMTRLDAIASEALLAAKTTTRDEGKPLQYAVYDTDEHQWRFADYPV